MNKAFNFLIVVALLLGVGCVILIKFYVDARVKQASASVPAEEIVYKEVLFAKEAISVGSSFTNMNTELRSIPENLVPITAVTSLEELEEKIALHDIPEDDILMTQKAGKPSKLPRASAVIPAGKRLITLSVDDTTAAGFTIKNGDFVDLVGVFRLEEGMLGREEMPIGNLLSVRFLQKVEVFDIIHGQTTAISTEKVGQPEGEEEADAGRLAQGTTATFLVTPQEAEIILTASNVAESLAMILRRYDDENLVEQPSELHQKIADMITGEFEAPVVEAAPVIEEPVEPVRKVVF